MSAIENRYPELQKWLETAEAGKHLVVDITEKTDVSLLREMLVEVTPDVVVTGTRIECNAEPLEPPLDPRIAARNEFVRTAAEGDRVPADLQRSTEVQRMLRRRGLQVSSAGTIVKAGTLYARERVHGYALRASDRTDMRLIVKDGEPWLDIAASQPDGTSSIELAVALVKTLNADNTAAEKKMLREFAATAQAGTIAPDTWLDDYLAKQLEKRGLRLDDGAVSE